MSKNYFSLIMSLALIGCVSSTSAKAAAVVSVKLTDNGVTMDLSKSMGLGMGMNADMTKATMAITVDPKSVPHGIVKFNVINSSKDVIHEMIISPVVDETKTLAYVDKENRVDEKAAIHLGEVSELDPGKSGFLTIDLKAGKYILFCNLPGHYMAGMWTMFDVK